MRRVVHVIAGMLGVAALPVAALSAPLPLSPAAPLPLSPAAPLPLSPTVPPTVPPGVNPETGARPGNEIGTGSSLPLSDKAGNITPGDTISILAPNLPSPAIGENASSRDYLLAARAALVLGRTGEAQQALEMAETRSLDRSVPLFKTDVRINDPLISEIAQALHALSDGDRERAVQIIEVALPHADQPATE